MPADKFARGEVVHTAMGSGRIVRFQRMHRQDGWVVQNVRQGPGEGTLPHWVPETSIERGPLPPAPGGGRNIEQILGVWPGEEPSRPGPRVQEPAQEGGLTTLA